MQKFFRYLPLLVLALPAALPANTVVEEIIARVNNQIITRTEYQRSQEQTRQESHQDDAANGDKVYAQRQRDVLRGLIDQQLLLERGKELDITADTELVKRLDQMRKQMNLGSMEELEKAAEGQGISFEDFKQNTRNRIITEQVISREVGSRMSLTKEEEQKYYEDHKNDLAQAEQVRLSEILVAIQKDEPDQVTAAQTKANGLLDQIQKGAKFEDIAKKNSEGPSAAQGGDLGYFKRGVLAKELEDKTFSMKAGEVSEAIRTRQGFVLLKVVEHHEAGIPAFKEIEPRIVDALYAEKMEPALRGYLTHLREDAYIDIKPGYVDSGASANQSKPIETDTKEANAKKLKKKKKLLLF